MCRLLLSIFTIACSLLFGGHALAQARSCESLFAEKSLSREEKLRQTLLRISNASEAADFWSDLGKTLEKDDFGFMNDLVHTDFIRPLVLLKPNLQPQEVENLSRIITQVASANMMTKKLVEPALFVLKPHGKDEVIRHFDEYAINLYSSVLDNYAAFAQEFNYSTVSALGGLSSETKASLKKYYAGLYRKSRNPRSGNKTAQRNIELIYRALHEPEFQTFYAKLKSSPTLSTDIASDLVTGFWRSMGFSRYPFSRVIDLAKEIQSGPLNPYLKNESVLLYGSFPNGKAIFPGSDIDLHLGPQLEHDYTAFFDKGGRGDGTYTTPKGTLTVEGKKLASALTATEDTIARRLGLNGKRYFVFPKYKPGQLLTIVNEKPMWDSRDPFRPENVSLANPIMLEISADTMILHVYDAFGTRAVQKIQIR